VIIIKYNLSLLKIKEKIKYLIVIILFIFIAVCVKNKMSLKRYSIGKNSDVICHNDQKYSLAEDFVVTRVGKKIGYVHGYYDIYEIKGQKTEEWLTVNTSGEPGDGRKVFINDSAKLPSLKDFNAKKVEIVSDNNLQIKKTINNIDDINKIVNIVTGDTENYIDNPGGGELYYLDFVSQQYTGIAYRLPMVISKNGNYYVRISNKLIEITDELKNKLIIY
jgi:hypothetical protein